MDVMDPKLPDSRLFSSTAKVSGFLRYWLPDERIYAVNQIAHVRRTLDTGYSGYKFVQGS
jgi:hypothetical protein